MRLQANDSCWSLINPAGTFTIDLALAWPHDHPSLLAVLDTHGFFDLGPDGAAVPPSNPDLQDLP